MYVFFSIIFFPVLFRVHFVINFTDFAIEQNNQQDDLYIVQERIGSVIEVENKVKNKVKNKRATSAYELFKKEFSQSPEMKGKKMSQITPLAKEQWKNIEKNEPETLNSYKEKAELLNKSK